MSQTSLINIRMRHLCVLLGAACLFASVMALEQNNDIDVVLNLLNDLSSNAKQELELLEQQWQQTRSNKQAIINSLSGSVQQQRGECNNRDGDVANKERDISITLNFIKWLEKRIVENKKRLDLFDQLRCRSNSNFIGDAKNNRRTQQLIAFLKRAIENASESNLPALLQKKEFSHHLEKFFKAQENIAILLQIRSKDVDDVDVAPSETEGESIGEVAIDTAPEAETEQEALLGAAPEDEDVEFDNAGPSEGEFSQLGSEAGSETGAELENEAEALADVVANEQSPASADSPRFSEAQQQLLDTLDSIDGEIKSMFSQFQNNQVVSAMGQNDFQRVIVRENQAFDEHLTQENENLTRLSNQLITVLQATAQCKARLQQLNQALTIANEDLSGAEENYNAIRERLLSEIDLFGDVYRVYKNQVGSQSQDYKQTVQRKIQG